MFRAAMFTGLLIAAMSSVPVSAAPRTENVVLVTLDGVRIQEIFGSTPFLNRFDLFFVR